MKQVAIAMTVAGLCGPALADCTLPEATAAAAAWRVIEGENFAFTAESEAMPGLSVDLSMDAPVIPEVLDFVVLDRYGGRIALLQYFSGDPGTSVLVTMVRDAIVDLQSGETLAAPLYSADCQRTAWTWFADHVEVADIDGVQRIVLPVE